MRMYEYTYSLFSRHPAFPTADEETFRPFLSLALGQLNRLIFARKTYV